MEFALNANQRAIEGREGRMAKAKLLDLLDYIEQVERLNRKPALIVPVGHYCAFEEELLSLPGLSLNPGSGAEEVWLRLECLESSDPPPPPALLAPWLPAGRNPEEPPELGRPAPGEASATPMPPDAALLQEALDQYRSGPWRAWAAA